VTFAGDDRLVTGDEAGWVTVWDLKAGKKIGGWAEHKLGVRALAGAPDGRTVASGSADTNVMVYDVPTGTRTLLFEGHTGAVWGLSFRGDSRQLASASNDRSIIIWDLPTRRRLALLRGHESSALGVAFHPGGEYLLTGGRDRTVRSWPAAEVSETRAVDVSARLHVVAFQPRGADAGEGLVALGGEKGLIGLHDTQTWKPVRRCEGMTGDVTALAFNPEGTRLAAAAGEATVLVFDPATGKEVSRLTHPARVPSLAWSGDGRVLATGTTAGQVHLWDARTWKPLGLFAAQTQYVRSLAFQPGGRLLAITGDRYGVKLCDWETGEVKQKLPEPKDVVHQSVFTPDGRHLVGVGREHSVFVWDVETGALAGGTARGRQHLAQQPRRLVQVGRQLALQPGVAALRAEVVPDQVGHPPGENLPQPAQPLFLGGPLEQSEITGDLEEGFLDEVVGVGLALQAAADLQAGQQGQVVAVQLEQLPQGRAAAGAGQAQELLRVQRHSGAHGASLTHDRNGERQASPNQARGIRKTAAPGRTSESRFCPS
jgi:WD40 repeat protein